MHELERCLCEIWPPAGWQDVTVLVGVSGGPDSVALLRAMIALRTGGEGRIVVGHLNHGLRGPDADHDARFVESLCGRYGLSCEIGKWGATDTAHGEKGSIEEAARKARYRFLRETADRSGARYIVAGHTADDQAETILHHILRGTGLRGLGGMKRSRQLGPNVSLIRPFLPVSRREILEYLAAIDQSYCEDGSNRDTSYTRNRLRHELIPLLARHYNPGVVDALLRLGQTAREAQEALEPLLKTAFDECVLIDVHHGVTIQCPRLAEHSRHLARELLALVWSCQGWPQQSMNFTKWDELAGMALTESKCGKVDKRMFPGGVTAERVDGQLRLYRNA